MTVDRNTHFKRQMHHFVGQRIASGELTLDDDAWAKLLKNNANSRAAVNGGLMTQIVDEWETILRARDREALVTLLMSEDRDSDEMFNVSPLSGVISQEDRLRILRDL